MPRWPTPIFGISVWSVIWPKGAMDATLAQPPLEFAACNLLHAIEEELALRCQVGIVEGCREASGRAHGLAETRRDDDDEIRFLLLPGRRAEERPDDRYIPEPRHLGLPPGIVALQEARDREQCIPMALAERGFPAGHRPLEEGAVVDAAFDDGMRSACHLCGDCRASCAAGPGYAGPGRCSARTCRGSRCRAAGSPPGASQNVRRRRALPNFDSRVC